MSNKSVRDKKYDVAHPVISFSWLTNFSQLSKGNFIIDLVTKGQKIWKENYGVPNSSKKQTKSEKEFDLKDPKAIFFFFFSFVFLKNWGRHKLVSIFSDLWYQIVMIPPKLLSLAEKPTKPVLQKSFFFDSIVFKWDSFDKSSLVIAMVVVFLYVVSCGLHSPENKCKWDVLKRNEWSHNTVFIFT